MTRRVRIPSHVGFIPDGNRRWADARGLARGEGYDAGIAPGIALLRMCREIGIREASVYGFTKENVRRPQEQVAAFREACAAFAEAAVAEGAALRAVGDSSSPVFPEPLLRYAAERSSGDIRLNLLVNYSWEWDLGVRRAPGGGWRRRDTDASAGGLATADIPRVDLVVRWGGRRRLSGFLPLQCAYADFYVVDALWPDMELAQFEEALDWYDAQDVTLGG